MSNKDIVNLELEKLKIEYDHCEKLVWNILWILTLTTIWLIVAVIERFLKFNTALLIFCLLSLTLTLSLIPVAKKSDNITKKKFLN